MPALPLAAPLIPSAIASAIGSSVPILSPGAGNIGGLF